MGEKKMIPPDGGWGWVVAMAYALNNVIMVPILQGFSLVLKDVFKKLNIDATDTTIILSINSAFGMGVGLIHGPLLRKFGYRKIALLGSTLFTIGITMTAFDKTFTQFLITYGLMASLGVALTMSSFSLAVNSYFAEKRGRAIGMAMAFTGLGPILMPQLISYLMATYGTQGAIIIIGGMTLHSLVGTLLLQPVKWHATWQTIDTQNEQSNSIKEMEPKDSASVTNQDECVMVESGTEATDRSSSINMDSNDEEQNRVNRRRSSESADRTLPYKWWNSARSLETVNLGSCTIFNENVHFVPVPIEENSEEKRNNSVEVVSTALSKDRTVDAEANVSVKEIPVIPGGQEKLIDDKSSDSCWRKVWKSIVRFFDLDLLRDPIYVNMMLGMSIAQFAEINFAILTPMILDDMKFLNNQIAIVMSTIAGVDMVSRGLVPFIGEWLRLPARHMALISLTLLIGFRTMLIFTRRFSTVIAVASGLGFAKGIRAVNMFLVIPNYIPMERLASATGIQMLVNGLVLLMLGPLLGFSRDRFGSYIPSLVLINTTTALTIVMWITEMFIVRRKTKRQEKKQQYQKVETRE